jgi:hypothetical protein
LRPADDCSVAKGVASLENGRIAKSLVAATAIVALSVV